MVHLPTGSNDDTHPAPPPCPIARQSRTRSKTREIGRKLPFFAGVCARGGLGKSLSEPFSDGAGSIAAGKTCTSGYAPRRIGALRQGI